MYEVLFILLGIITGAVAGLVGVGGGIIVVPALVYLFGFTQKMAQGTTLAMLIPPIGFFAAYTYYKAGQVNVKAALFIIVGFMLGSYFGAHLASTASNSKLTRVFGVFLLVAAVRMIVAG